MNTSESFDWHLGAVVEGLAIPHGGRQFLISLLPWSRNTLIRRIKGEAEFTVKELEVVADAVNSTAGEIIAQALRNYSNGSADDGLRKLIATERTSDAPASLDAHRQKKMPADMTDDELEGERSAANTDPEIGYDEPDTP